MISSVCYAGNMKIGDLVYLYNDDIICDEQAMFGIIVDWQPELRRYKVLINEQFHWLSDEYMRVIK